MLNPERKPVNESPRLLTGCGFVVNLALGLAIGAFIKWQIRRERQEIKEIFKDFGEIKKQGR